jgi:hypothetical protein
MAWTNELEQLHDYVREHFGDEAVRAAVARAFATVTAGDGVDQLIPGELPPLEEPSIVTSDGRVFSMDGLYDALLAELRSLARPQ